MASHLRRASISQPLLAALAILASAVVVRAQAASPPPSSPPQTAAAVAGDDDANRTDAIDLIRMWRKKPPRSQADIEREAAWAIVPILSSKPSTGVKLGVGADVEFNLGDAATTRYSSVTSALAFSTHKQISVSENLRLFGRDNAWMFDGQNHYSGGASDNVTLGTSSTAGLAPDIRFYSLQFFDTYYHRVAGNLYAGAGLYIVRQMEIEPFPSDSPEWDASPFRTYSAAHGFDAGAQTASGPGVALRFDNRDNQNDAARGWYAAATFRAYVDGFLGGNSTWEATSIDVRTYRRITPDARHKLAFWGLADFTSGAAPYLSLPTSGGDEVGRSSRGYADGRFRGERLVYGEAEYRGLVTRNGFFGIAAFVNMTTVSNRDTGEQLFDSVAIGGGAGVRLLLHKQSRSNLCVDYAFGRNGSHGLYISLRDAF
jgi:outer membrane protein assembly factor BamA